jgi:hypothetical protein
MSRASRTVARKGRIALPRGKSKSPRVAPRLATIASPAAQAAPPDDELTDAAFNKLADAEMANLLRARALVRLALAAMTGCTKEKDLPGFVVGADIRDAIAAADELLAPGVGHVTGKEQATATRACCDVLTLVGQEILLGRYSAAGGALLVVEQVLAEWLRNEDMAAPHPRPHAPGGQTQATAPPEVASSDTETSAPARSMSPRDWCITRQLEEAQDDARLIEALADITGDAVNAECSLDEDSLGRVLDRIRTTASKLVVRLEPVPLLVAALDAEINAKD